MVDFQLDPRLTDAITVTADAPRINTTNAEVKGSLTSEQIMDKPTASPGSFLGLAETFTGFQENPTSGQNNPTASSGSSINFNGTGTRGATFQINGVNNDDSSENQNRQGAALSTIKEFQVLKSSYSAEFGRGDGAVVLGQTKSGTNTLHGDGYWYKQDNDGWNAKSFFAPTTPKPVRTRDQYGFTAGFPIKVNTLSRSRTSTLNLGLRYEYVAAPKERENRIDYVYGADTDNIEPRLGVVYAPKWNEGFLGRLAGGTGNFSIRGGWGMYDGRIFQSVFSQGGANVRFNPPNALSRTLSTLPDILNISDPSNGYVFVPGPQTSRVAITIPDPNLEMPATTKMNISVDRAMPFESTLRISYERNHNDKRLKYALDNLPLSPLDGPITVVNHPFNAPTGTFPDLRGKVIDRVAADANCAGTGFYNLAVTAACPNTVPIADDEISARVPRTNERRPNPLYTTNLLISNDAESWYDGIEFEWIKRTSHGLEFQAAYTFSKSVDTTSEATFVGAGDTNQNGPNAKYAKGLSRFHTPHRFTLNGSYRLPFFEGRRDLAGQVLGGWQISDVLKIASGTPFSVTDSTAARPDLTFDGFAETRPVLLDPSILGNHITDPSTSQQLLPRTAFRSSQYGDPEDQIVPRNAFYGDGFWNVDLAASKIFQMPWRGHSMGVRIEMFNAFNRVQFNFPTVDIASPSFGRILTGATNYAPRVIQLVLRYRY